MSMNEDYNMQIEFIKKITDDQIIIPGSIPIATYLQEAEFLYTWCQDDKDELMAKGMNWTTVEDLKSRCGALREAEAIWSKVKFSRTEEEITWFNESPSGHELRNELLHHFRYAFRNDSSLLLKVRRISYSNTHASMIQGLSDLYVLGINNRDLLNKINFDFNKLGLAAKKAEELKSMYASADMGNIYRCEIKKIRDQAYTHLKKVVDFIRAYGRYVFIGNPDRLKGYRSNYLRKITLKSKILKNVPETVSDPETGLITLQE